MKKLFFYIVTVFVACYSQKTFGQDPDFVIAKNADYVATTDDGTKIIASDVYSRTSELKRSIRLVDPRTGGVIGEAFIQLTSNDRGENMYDKIKKDPNNFSGILSVEIDNQPVYLRQITDGVVSGGQFTERVAGDGVPGPFYNPKLTCTIGHVHDCVAYNIEGMSLISYIFCLVSAPSCYAEQWLNCGWQVCHNHMQYTNPN